MAMLKSRDRFPPGGFKFYEPATKWRPPDFASFDTIVRLLIAHRTANRFVLKDKPTDYESVATEVDFYNASQCLSMGWKDFINAATPEAPVPKSLPPLKRLARLAAGAVSIIDLIKKPEEAVPAHVSEARAGVCAKCHANQPGGLESFFTVPVSGAIQAALGQLRSLNLSTSLDDKLNVCEICLCPMKLKVHFPMETLLKHLPQDVLEDLRENVPSCWILTELDHDQNQNQRRAPGPGENAFVHQAEKPAPPVLPGPDVPGRL